jgi:hypothetical protein
MANRIDNPELAAASNGCTRPARPTDSARRRAMTVRPGENGISDSYFVLAFGRPLPRFTFPPLPLAALVVFAEVLPSAG